jgi:hypothetical protein
LLALNPNGEKVEVIHADAFEYLPPEPVDVVICEMIHVGMLREKQVEVIESFKRRYTERRPAAGLPAGSRDHGGAAAAAGIRFRGLLRAHRAIPGNHGDYPGTVELARRPCTASSISTSRTSSAMRGRAIRHRA